MFGQNHENPATDCKTSVFMKYNYDVIFEHFNFDFWLQFL